MNPPTASRAFLVGATGLVGGRLLARLTDDPRYGAVTTLGRRAPPVEHERVTHLVRDLSAAGAVAPIETDVVFCCLGTTIKQAGSRHAFRAVDFDLVVNVARAASEGGTGSMIVVSSVGADPGSGNFYLRTKGEMEQAISTIGFTKCGIVRPSMLLGERDEFRPAETLGKIATRLVNPLLAGGLAKYRGVDAGTVAAAMIGLDRATFEGVRIIEGREIQHFAAEPMQPRRA